MRVEQFLKNSHASFYMHQEYDEVMLLGRTEVVDDEESCRKVWRDGDDYFDSRGFDDLQFKFLKFTPERGRLNDEAGVNDFVVP